MPPPCFRRESDTRFVEDPGAARRIFVDALINASYNFMEETYLGEQSTEAGAMDWFLHQDYKYKVVAYGGRIPGTLERMILCQGFLTAPPESLDIFPNVSWKVFQDLQWHVAANDPAFANLAGGMSYHSSYADEEVLRWTAKLYRHYLIEGNTERLSVDPYTLTHLINADFQHGTSNWTLSMATSNSIVPGAVTGYGWLQGRYFTGGVSRYSKGLTPGGPGSTVLVTKRSLRAANRFSQPIKGLRPGRTYSLKLFAADYDEFLAGVSNPNGVHHFSIEIGGGAQPIETGAITERFNSAEAGHTSGPFNRTNGLAVTFARRLFTASGSDGSLVISDWSTKTMPGGAALQRLMFNFVEVAPYLVDNLTHS
jgi:hypothetical protein